MKRLKIFLLATVIVAALQGVSCAENSEQLELLNDTGQAITSLYIAPVGNMNWGKDFAAQSPFEARQRRTVKYNPAVRYYKLKVILDDGREITWADNKRIDFAGAWRIVLYYGKRDVLKYVIYRSPKKH